MISNSLLKFAANTDWHAAEDEKYVFGKFNNYCFTATSKDALSSFFVPLAGISPENLLELSNYLESEHFPLKLVDYEMTDNFLSIRAKDTLFNASAKQIERFLTVLTAKLKELDLDPQNCIFCGQHSETESLYVGLYAYAHPECLDKESIDYTASFKANDKENEEFLILHKDTDGEDLIAVSATEDIVSELPSDEIITELAAQMDTYRAGFVRDLSELCQIPSVKAAAEENAPFGKETVRALEVFLRQANDLGFRTKNINNMAGYAEYGPEEAKDMIACVCHLDVVPAGDGWEADPWTLRQEDGKLIARGVNDDKGPALAALYAIKALMDDSGYTPDKRLRVIVGLDEESGSSCMEYYVKNEEIPQMGFTADANFPAIYAEKGICRMCFELPRLQDDQIASANAGDAVNMVPGSCNVELKDGTTHLFSGIIAHGSRPELGENAILTAVNSLLESSVKDSFLDFYEKYFSDLDGDALGLAFNDESGSTTINAGLLTIDEEKTELIVDMRYPVSMDLDARFNALKDKMINDNISVEIQDHADPLYLPQDSELVKTLMQVYNEGTATKGHAIAIGGGTYARSVPNICAYGPAFPGDPDIAHQANEWIKLDSILAAASIYRDAFRKLALND